MLWSTSSFYKPIQPEKVICLAKNQGMTVIGIRLMIENNAHNSIHKLVLSHALKWRHTVQYIATDSVI